MIRPQHLVAIIIAPNAPMFADCDVAGRAVGEHLIGAIAARAGRGIDALAIGPATSMSEWCRSACSAWVTDVETAARSNGDWLVINGNAWFGDGAIDVVLSAAANAPHGLRAVSPTVSEGLAGAEVLAVYVPREILLTARETGSTTALENLLRRMLSERPMMDPLLVMEVAVDGMLVEDYRDVAKVERRVLAQRAATALQQGVRMRDPDSVHIRGTLTCGSNVTIDIGVIFEGDVSLGDGVRIDAHSIVSRSSIGAGTVSERSHSSKRPRWERTRLSDRTGGFGQAASLATTARLATSSRSRTRASVAAVASITTASLATPSLPSE